MQHKNQLFQNQAINSRDKFVKIKTEFLSLKWHLDNLDDCPTTIIRRNSKIAKLMFELEHEFNKRL